MCTPFFINQRQRLGAQKWSALDGPKAALLVRNRKLGGAPVAPFSLASGLRSECFNPPRSVLAGPDGKPVQRRTRNATAGVDEPEDPNSGRAWSRQGLGKTSRGLGDLPALRRTSAAGRGGRTSLSALCGAPRPRARRNSIQTTLGPSGPHRHEESPSQLQHRWMLCTPLS